MIKWRFRIDGGAIFFLWLVFIGKIKKRMKRKIIRLTESDIRDIVKRSVKRALKESIGHDLDDYVMEEEIEFVDPKFFGDNDTHYYDCKCYDGYALGHISAGEEEMNGPEAIRIVYPTLEEVLQDDNLAHEILRYRGLDKDFGPEGITYGDIMMKLGEIEGEL